MRRRRWPQTGPPPPHPRRAAGAHPRPRRRRRLRHNRRRRNRRRRGRPAAAAPPRSRTAATWLVHGSPPPRLAATRGAPPWETAAETRPAPKLRRAWQAVVLRRAVGLGAVVRGGAEVGGCLECSVPFPRLVARRPCWQKRRTAHQIHVSPVSFPHPNHFPLPEKPFTLKCVNRHSGATR